MRIPLHIKLSWLSVQASKSQSSIEKAVTFCDIIACQNKICMKCLWGHGQFFLDTWYIKYWQEQYKLWKSSKELLSCCQRASNIMFNPILALSLLKLFLIGKEIRDACNHYSIKDLVILAKPKSRSHVFLLPFLYSRWILEENYKNLIL